MAEKADTVFKKYELKGELGRGAFSLVKLGVERATGKKVAVKIIEKKNVGAEYKKNLEVETEILKRVSHPSVIKLIEMFDTEEYLFLVMELVTGGELFDRIVSKGCYTESEASALVRRIVEAIEYLHGQGICHRDLKPENLLLASEESDVDIKLADFGLSKIISKKVMMQTACIPEDHQVLTSQGFMDLDTYVQCSAQDPSLQVATYRSTTQQMHMERPIRVAVLPEEKRELVEFSSESLSYAVTRDHDVYVALSSNNAPTKVKAENLIGSNVGSITHVTAASNGVGHRKWNNRDLLMQDLGLKDENQWHSFLRVSGYWLSSGSLASDGTIRFSTNQVESHLAPLSCSFYSRDASVVVQPDASSRSWMCTLVDNMYTLPNWVWSCNVAELRMLLEGLLFSSLSGTFDAKGNVVLCDQVVRIMLMAGLSASVTEGTKVVFAHRPSVTANEPVHVVERSCRVWCLTMPSGLFWVRRVGRDPQTGSIVNASCPVVTGNCGTPGYVAPEVLNATGYDKEVDMWSIGVITYILLCGFPPFYGDSMPILFEQILEGRYDYPEDYWRDVSDEARDFIDHLLVVDRHKRFSAEQALKHPWLSGKKAEKKLPIGIDLKNLVKNHRTQSAHLASDFEV